MNGEIRTHALSGRAVLQTGALNHLATFTYFFLKNLTAYTSLQWWVLPSYEVAGFLVCSSLLQTLVQREVGYCTVYTGIVTNKGFTVQALS